MRNLRKISIVIPLAFVGLVLAAIIGYCAKYYLIDRSKELKEAENVDTTYIKREMSLATLIEMPTMEGNAASYYIKALKLEGEKAEDETLHWVEGMDLIYNTEAKSLDYILAGAQKKDCDFATMEYQTAKGIVNFPTPTDLPWNVRTPAFISALRFARALAAKGDRHFVLGEIQKARQIYESILVFGHHLESSRQTMMQLMVGVAVSDIGIERLEKFYSYQGDTEKLTKVNEYRVQSEEMKVKLYRKRGVMAPWRLEQFEARIRILKEDEDAMFRREAASNLLFFVTPIRLAHLFRRGKATRALEEAMQNDEDLYVRETARNILNFARSISDRKVPSKTMPFITDFSETSKKRAREKTTQPDSVETRLEKGLRFHREKRFNEAIDAYKQAVNLQPGCATAHHRLGVAYHGKGMLADAKNEYKLSLKLDPDGVYTFVVHNDLGKLYKDKQMYDEAISEYKRTVALKPEYILAYVSLAEAYSSKGLYDEAITELKQALYISDYLYISKLQGNFSAYIFYNLARIYSLKDDKYRAIESLKKAIESSRKYIRMAKDNKDFDNIRNTSGFQSILYQGYGRRERMRKSLEKR